MHRITNITLDGSMKIHKMDKEVISIAIQAIGGAAEMAVDDTPTPPIWTIAAGSSIAMSGRALRETGTLYFFGATGTVQILETIGLNT